MVNCSPVEPKNSQSTTTSGVRFTSSPSVLLCSRSLAFPAARHTRRTPTPERHVGEITLLNVVGRRTAKIFQHSGLSLPSSLTPYI